MLLDVVMPQLPMSHVLVVAACFSLACVPAEKIVNPIMKNVYQAGGGAGGAEGGEEEDFGADDL